MNPVRIGVALTCFNRCAKTQACLEALYRSAAHLGNDAVLEIVVTDDGSIDGTAEMLHECFPAVEVIAGNGQLYWAGGMRLAFGRLLSRQLDHYLWLNDDTVLFPDALASLLATQRFMLDAYGRGGIAVGSTCDFQGRLTYGGLRRRAGPLGLLSFERVPPGPQHLTCETHNGNAVLVSAQAAGELGNLDTVYRHGMADLDYGLRARALGIPICVMPGFAGQCIYDHGVVGSYMDKNLPLAKRWKLLTSPKGLPFNSWFHMCWRHTGALWPLYFTWPYAKTLLLSAARTR